MKIVKEIFRKVRNQCKSVDNGNVGILAANVFQILAEANQCRFAVFGIAATYAASASDDGLTISRAGVADD